MLNTQLDAVLMLRLYARVLLLCPEALRLPSLLDEPLPESWKVIHYGSQQNRADPVSSPSPELLAAFRANPVAHSFAVQPADADYGNLTGISANSLLPVYQAHRCGRLSMQANAKDAAAHEEQRFLRLRNRTAKTRVQNAGSTLLTISIHGCVGGVEKKEEFLPRSKKVANLLIQLSSH